jgi:maltoporin
MLLGSVVWGWLLAVSLAAQSPPAATEVEQIRREMQQLRQDYEQRMRALEERLNQFASPPPTPVPSPTPPVAAPAATNALEQMALARQTATEQFAGTTESRQRALSSAEDRPMQERLDQVLNNFVDFTGYFRAGYGRDNEGGPQVAFQAQGALSKYRLGNEAENYLELSLSKTFFPAGMFDRNPARRPADTTNGPVAFVKLTGSAYNPYSDLGSASGTDFGLPEAWAAIGNVVHGQASLKFWAGERFYRRHDIHISDFYFQNMSGAGAGAEDLQLPFGRMAFAWIGAASQSGVSDLPVPDAQNEAGYSKSNFDLRLYDVGLPWGQGEFGVTVAREDSGQDANGNDAQNANGVALSFLHMRDKFLSDDGFNKFSLQWGQGPAKTFVSGFDYFTLNGDTYIRPDPADSWRFRVTEHFVAQPWEHLSIGPALVYQYTDFTTPYGGQQHWLSFGVRPVIQFNRHFSLAFEPGVDWVKDSQAGSSGALFKFSIAPQVALGPGFFNRPVLRVFFTYASWPTAFRGQVGGQDYLDATTGMTFGAQVEAWW